MKVLKKGPAMRVIFFYPGEEGTYVDNANVTLYENGIVHIRSNQEETTTHLQNCEILWSFEVESAEDRANKVRLLKPREEVSPRAKADKESSSASLKEPAGEDGKPEGKPPKGSGSGSSKNPELR